MGYIISMHINMTKMEVYYTNLYIILVPPDVQALFDQEVMRLKYIVIKLLVSILCPPAKFLTV